jgi:hypothetical protein
MLIKRSIAALKRQAGRRPEGYVDQVLAEAERVEGEHYWIERWRYLALCRRWGSLPTVANPRAQPRPKPRPFPPPTRGRQALNLAKAAAHAATSVAKTTIGIDRVFDELVQARLNVCRQCPGGHATWKNGDVHTCGPMLESVASTANDRTCGCLLKKKARDLAEGCPFGWW